MTPLNPSCTGVYIQKDGAGHLCERFAVETEVSAPSGGGFSFESDYGASTYLKTRRTSNQARYGVSIQSRREDVSELRKLMEDNPSRLYNLIVLTGESVDVNFETFVEGEIYTDAGITNHSVSSPIARGTDGGDPKGMDSIDFTAARRIEIRPLAEMINPQMPEAGDVDEDYYATALIYAPQIRTAYDSKGTLFLLLRRQSTNGTLLLANEQLGEGAWSTVTTTGLPASGANTDMILVGNRLLIGSGSTGVYAADLSFYGTSLFSFSLTAGFPLGTEGVHRLQVIDKMKAIAVGSIGVTVQVWLTRDGGYSFDQLNTAPTTPGFQVAVTDENLIWFLTTPLSNGFVRLKNLMSFESVSLSGTGISGNVTYLAVPPNRPDELYFATSNGELYRAFNVRGRSDQIRYERIYVPDHYWNTTQQISSIQFVGDRGEIMVLTQFANNGSVYRSRALLDYSGGAGANAFRSLDYISMRNRRVLTINPNYFVSWGYDTEGAFNNKVFLSTVKG